MKARIRRALPYSASFLALLLTEIIIGSFASGWIRGYLGDVLVLPLLYCLIRIFTPALPRSLPLWLFALGCLAELLQLLRFAELLGFPEGSLPAVILGTRADWRDILCYAIGAVLLYAAMRLLHGLSHMPQKFRRISAVFSVIAVTIGLGICWVQIAVAYRFDYDPDWMLGRSLHDVQKRYVRYDAQERRDERLEEQGYVFIAQECYFRDFISSAGDFYYLYYVKCDENNIVTDVQVVDTGIGG